MTDGSDLITILKKRQDIGNDEAELELSVESRSFVNRVNDQVRKKDRNEFPTLQEMEKNIL